MEVIGKLFDGPLDIVGDIHGEAQALDALLAHLGYDGEGRHPEGRRLVFLGNLVDRGPDSPAVIDKVRSLVERGAAQCILGNHELNILLGKRRYGNECFYADFDDGQSPTNGTVGAGCSAILDFFNDLPMALERDDLRVVHACWHEESIASIAGLDGEAAGGMSLTEAHGILENGIQEELKESGIADQREQEKRQYGDKINYGYNDPYEHWPEPVMLDAHAATDVAKQMGNSIKVLTSGLECKAAAPFPANGKFRFAKRVKWWNEYAGDKPVVVGHYWRKFRQTTRKKNQAEDLFDGVEPEQWMGLNHNVYCVDFSIGLSAEKRAKEQPTDDCSLAALRWPEQVVVFHDGQSKRLIRRWSQETYRKAWNFASRVHDGQTVPGQTYAYLNHLGAVAMEVIACLEGDRSFDDPDLAVQCALLHDCMEDAGVTYDRLVEQFGSAVADGVQALTKTNSLPTKQERMQDSLSRIREQPREVWIVKLADRITNLQPPPRHWSNEKIANYRVEAELILIELGDASEYLAARLQHAIRSYGI